MMELKYDLAAMGFSVISKKELEALLEIDPMVERSLRIAAVNNARVKIKFKDGALREGLLDSPMTYMKCASDFEGGFYWFKNEFGFGEKLFYSNMVESVEKVN
jgi:hypothetical protein